MAALGYSVLSGAELTRIRKQIEPVPVSVAHLEKEALKKLSDERASQWPNTIQAQRARKERARADRLEAEEEEKKKIDVLEAALKAEHRQLQIERANKILYDETDKVKAFHSSLLLSDVLKERELQITYKASREELKKKHEQQFVQRQKEALELAEETERRKFEERKRRALVERDAQLAQLEELRSKLLAERAEDRREGAQLKLKAEEEVRVMQAKEEDRRERARQNNQEVMQANEALRAFREIELAREREQEIKIAEFSKKKEAMIIGRRRREEQKQAEKQAQRDKMLAQMEKNLLELRSQADQRLKVQEEVARANEDAREAERAEIRRQENAAIDVSRKQQLDIKAMRRDIVKREEEAFVAQWKVRNQQLREEEEAAKAAQFARNKKLQSAHLVQMDKKLRKAENERIAALEDDMATQLVMQEDDELFKHYTNVCMEEWKSQGKNITPMLLEISKKEKFAK